MSSRRSSMPAYTTGKKLNDKLSFMDSDDGSGSVNSVKPKADIKTFRRSSRRMSINSVSSGRAPFELRRGSVIVGATEIITPESADVKSETYSYLEHEIPDAFFHRAACIVAATDGHKLTSTLYPQSQPRILNPNRDSAIISHTRNHQLVAKKTKTNVDNDDTMVRRTSVSNATVSVSTKRVPRGILQSVMSGHLSQSEKMGERLQLMSIFCAHDDDEDGYLTKDQLSSCLLMIGFPSIRENILKKYFSCEIEKGSKLTESEIKSLSAAEKRNLKLAPSARKISLSSFLEVTISLLPSINERILNDIGNLFDFITAESGERNSLLKSLSDNYATSNLTMKSLRHVMVDSFSPSSLSKEEFASFMLYHGIQVPNISGDSDQDRCLSTSNVINNMTIGAAFKEIE